MVGWIDLIGRFISFMLEKLAGRKIDLSFDERRKAARQFLRLYHAVSDLEVVTKELIVELRDMAEANDPTVPAEWLREVSIAVDETSQRFLEATQGLCEVLEIFDPVLALSVGSLEAHKFSFLLMAAQGFEPVERGEAMEVKYTQPGRQESELDLAKTYEWYAERYPLDVSKPLEWPDEVLLSFLSDDGLQHDRLTLSQPESMIRLANLLDKHLRSLSTAREGLAALLRARFNLEDLLAVQEPVNTFDRTHVMYRMSDAVRVPYVRLFAGKPPHRFRPQDKPGGTNPQS